MISDIAVKRPVLASVASLLLIAFGLIAYQGLPLRELPDVDRPVVSVSTTYIGASAEIVETTITQPIEDQLSGIEGLDFIASNSRDGRSQITLEFDISRDLDDAANDVRNAVARAQGQLPDEVEPPVIEKADADAEPIIFFNIVLPGMSRIEATDYVERNIVDRLSTVPGVSSVFVGGAQRRAMRIWLDPVALAARGLTPDDVDSALRTQNLESPAGQIEGPLRDYNLRIARSYQSPEDFRAMPITRGAAGAPVVRLGDVARVELGPDEDRRMLRGNGRDQLGIGIVRQSKANSLEVGRLVKAEMEAIKPTLPPGSEFVVASDSTIFIEEAVNQVFKTLAEAVVLTLLVIVLFLGALRPALVPAAVVPVCIVGIFLVLSVFGFSVNLITILAIVLSVGLVVDDAIVVMENCQRRVDLGEPPLVAAQRGTRQVAFAVIATTAVLVSVFTPLLFMGGFTGRLFVELAATIAGAVVISAFVALTLSPVLCSVLLRPSKDSGKIAAFVDKTFGAVSRSYGNSVRASLKAPIGAGLVVVLALGGAWFLFNKLSSELVPAEDRGNMFMRYSGPVGSGFENSKAAMLEAEKILLPYVEGGEVQRILLFAPGFGGGTSFDGGTGRIFLAPWENRERSAQEIADEMTRSLGSITAGQFFISQQSALGGRGGGANQVEILITGGDYAKLAETGQKILDRVREDSRFSRTRINYEPVSPRVLVEIDRERAAALGVSVQQIGRTLESLAGSRRTTTFPTNGEEYDVVLQLERQQRQAPEDLTGIQVRSERTGALIPLSNFVTFTNYGDTDNRPRTNRQRSVQLSATLTDGFALGDALNVMETIAREEIQPGQGLDFDGTARQFKEAGSGLLFTFALALIIVFLTLAAQFESWIHPATIMLTVPLAIAGGLFGLYAFGATLNIYSQIGLVILVALAAKNGILLVEFANQLRDEGRSVRDAIIEAAELRLRPILMTSIATVAGAVPLMLGEGAGVESRRAIGVVIVFGVLASTALTLYVLPIFYALSARFTRSPETLAREIARFEHDEAVAAANDSKERPVAPPVALPAAE